MKSVRDLYVNYTV